MRTFIIYIGFVIVALALSAPDGSVIQAGHGAKSALPNILLWLLSPLTNIAGKLSVVCVGIALVLGALLLIKKK